ncbi:MAG: U32 family peptidase [Bacilli bacterium]|nr:U32 family peptidase [Bacilli bacterium]
MIELLSPAGDMEKLEFACLYGADAIYIGGRDYSLRANAKNFSNEEIKIAVEYVHNLGKKLYVTVNIVLHNQELDGLKEYLLYLDSIDVDGIIVSDYTIMNLHKELNLKLELHISTQASITNYETALFYKDLGAKRVVLARECSREDIKKIKEITNLDLECFIHGAMCTSISGRCVLSNYCTNRDSNRGGCAQICRWEFERIDKDGNKTTEIPFSMTPKDLNMVSNIEDMINIGVNSFKIEGRMRSIYYIATVILTYRRIIDKIVNNSLTDAYTNYCLNILNRCANRESTPQFYNKLPGKDEQYFLGRQEVSNQDFLGLVLDYKDGVATIEQRNYFKVGDIVQFFGPDTETFNYKIEEIIDENNESIDVARHPRMIVKIKINNKLNKYDMMRIKVFDF